ncbi:LysR substrate-binding domain-containing protein [Plesiomonas shigelloides subsp. oncorhynchi]|nr:LysR substrate-binding domain-containing protein [Plesiomonas shigelloides]
MVFLRQDHPLLKQEWSLENFLACPQISMIWEANDTWALDNVLNDEGLKRHVPIMVSSFEQALHIASQSSHELIAIAPSYCTSYAQRHHGNLIAKPLPLAEQLYTQLDIHFILLWHKRHNQDAKVMWLRNEIKGSIGKSHNLASARSFSCKFTGQFSQSEYLLEHGALGMIVDNHYQIIRQY